jgi:hypothetical protein
MGSLANVENLILGFVSEADMISNVFRERLVYTAMSVFVVWHTVAIVLAPGSENSVMAQGLRAVLQPYLTLFCLDNSWDFFAPSVDMPRTSRQFAYVIEDKAGAKRFFMPESEFSGIRGPNYFWFRGWYSAIVDNSEDYADVAADHYCRRHASLHPVSITLVSLQEKEFTRADFLAGKQRWDPELITAKTIKNVKCHVE